MEPFHVTHILKNYFNPLHAKFIQKQKHVFTFYVICPQLSVHEITYPLPNFYSYTNEVWGWISTTISHFMIDMINLLDYLSMLGLMLIRVDEMGSGIKHSM